LGFTHFVEETTISKKVDVKSGVGSTKSNGTKPKAFGENKLTWHYHLLVFNAIPIA
jgi:hypothetical protein